MKIEIYKTLARIKYDKVPEPKKELQQLYKKEIPQGHKLDFKRDLYKNIKRF